MPDARTTSAPATMLEQRSAPGRARAGWSPLVWPALALLLLFAWNGIFTEGFFSITTRGGNLYGPIIDIFDRAAPLAIVALGMTLVIATGGIDLSVGAVVAISGSVAATLMIADPARGFDMPMPAAVALALLVCCACGAISGMLVSLLGVQPIVATLILMVAGRGIAQGVGQNVPIDPANPFGKFGNDHFAFLPFAITMALAVLLATLALTRGTALGLFIRSVGNNPLASRLAGVQVRTVTFAVYVFSGLCAGIAGLIVASEIRLADANKAGLYLELDAILAVVVGGTALTGGRFYLVGSALGALLIQTLTITIYRSNIEWQYALVIKAAVVLVVCLLQSPEFRRRFVLRRAAA